MDDSLLVHEKQICEIRNLWEICEYEIFKRVRKEYSIVICARKHKRIDFTFLGALIKCIFELAYEF